MDLHIKIDLSRHPGFYAAGGIFLLSKRCTKNEEEGGREYVVYLGLDDESVYTWLGVVLTKRQSATNK